MIRAQSSYSLSDCIRIATTENARVDLATAKNHLSIDKLFQAQAQRLQAKYEYLFRLKMVDFYSGKPL